MSTSLQPEPKAAPALTPTPKPFFTPVQGGVLQRKCACGGSQGLAGDCKECGKKRLTLERYSTDRAKPSSLLSSLAEVSDPGSRTIVEAISGHDFSRVQVHTRAPRGIQTKLAVSQPGDQYEQEADRTAEQVMRASVPAISEWDHAVPSPVAAPPTEQMSGDDMVISAQSDRAEETLTPGATPAEAAPETAAPEETAAAGLIVEDEAQQVGPEQMRKNEFLDELQSAVCTAADAELAAVGRTAQGCPYIEQWIAYYRTRDSQYIERAIRRYAPGTVGIASAREYIPVLAERVRRAVAVWATTGRITGVPEGVSPEAPGAGAPAGGGSPPSAAGNILFKGREGGARDADPQAIQAQLGSGHSLDGSVRSRMVSAFGHDFSRVRVHTDSRAAGLAVNLNARAFTVGSDIAFGAGEYQPGTLVGDALLAHELAHVVQQGGSAPSTTPMPKGGVEYNSLEEDADNSAVGAVVSLWGRAKRGLANVAQNALPRFKSGLNLQRCPSKTPTTPRLRKRTVSGPTAGDCGKFSWGAQWYLDNPGSSNGWIIQKLDSIFGVKNCDDTPLADIKAHTGGRIDPAWYPYWEAWEVRSGAVYVGSSTTPHSADTYSSGGFGDNTKGDRNILGDAEFYLNLILPSTFSVRAGHPARALPVATSAPTLTGGTGSLAHNLKATWNCCPSSTNKLTTLEPT